METTKTIMGSDTEKRITRVKYEGTVLIPSTEDTSYPRSRPQVKHRGADNSVRNVDMWTSGNRKYSH